MRFLRPFRPPQRPSHWPHPRRLADAPRVTADPGDASRLMLRGVVCGVCASRTQSALASVPGVEAVTVDLGESTAQVRYAPGAEVSEATLQRALEGAVVGMSARRLVERVVDRFRRPAPRKGL